MKAVYSWGASTPDDCLAFCIFGENREPIAYTDSQDMAQDIVRALNMEATRREPEPQQETVNSE